MKNYSGIILVVIFQLLLSIPSVFAADAGWITAEGSASMENVTKEEARRFAIEDAMRHAVEEGVGVKLLAEDLLKDTRLIGSIIKATPYGRVLDKEIIEERVETFQEDPAKPPLLNYIVRIKAKVVKEEGDIDPYFKIDALLNRSVFKEGDEIEIRARATRDCYLHIFNILEDEKVLTLLPNRHKMDNLIKAGKAFTFPDRDDRRQGMTLKTHAVEGKSNTTETIYLLCLKQPLKFDSVRFTEGIYGIYEDRSGFINDLLKEIVEIPLSERAERFIQYSVSK